ncbi:hypothetical protein [Streptomyces sp. NPDC047061]|uniref:hypothetical protein n=1 Tax=Streptomyces sp. NPDC047061 TaxID=3154605 RepID=UPI0033DF45FA
MPLIEQVHGESDDTYDRRHDQRYKEQYEGPSHTLARRTWWPTIRPTFSGAVPNSAVRSSSPGTTS